MEPDAGRPGDRVQPRSGRRQVEHRFDRFEHELLATVDRRLRAQTWMTLSTFTGLAGVIVAAIRL
jgi:hypothetical protein